MTDAEKFALCRAMCEQPADIESCGDDVLSTYLSIAGQKILNRAYPYDDTVVEVPRRYGYLQCEIAVYLLNKRGAEGELMHTENGITRQYESADVPDSMLADVIPVCGVF